MATMTATLRIAHYFIAELYAHLRSQATSNNAV